MIERMQLASYAPLWNNFNPRISKILWKKFAQIGKLQYDERFQGLVLRTCEFSFILFE